MSTTYWQDHYNQGVLNYPNALLKQVGKTVNGKEVSQKQVDIIIDRIQKMLSLNRTDILLDACCGNGLLTYRFAPIVAQVIAIDFSEQLIFTAQKYHNLANIRYINSNLIEFKTFIGCNKILMYEALQLFSYAQFEILLQHIKNISDNLFLFYIASVPDKDQLWNYYNTPEKRRFYLKSEEENKPHIGTWWEKQYIADVCEKHRIHVQFLEQDAELYTSYYRFDMLLSQKR
jgi:cyclopropane fatty-acyl-phospholipid synthase-like methyltransferase